MQTLARRGVNDPLAILGEMADAMPSFKRILDSATSDAIDELGRRFGGFYRYAKVLELIAAKLESGEMIAPK